MMRGNWQFWRAGLARAAGWRMALALALMLATGLGGGIGPGLRVAVAEASGKTDLTGHWAEQSVRQAMAAGLVNGFPDGTFRPDDPVTRAQFIKLMAMVQQLPSQPGTGGFADLDSHWLATQGIIQAAVSAHLVEPSDYQPAPSNDPTAGVALPALNPEQTTTRQEAAVLASRAMNRLGAALTLHGAPLPYPDPGDAWASGYFAAVASAGVMTGHADGALGPHQSLTRAQAAVIALRVLDAAGRTEVPVWEGNSWNVSTLDYQAAQVTGAPDGTLYWLTENGEVWRMAPGAAPAKIYSGVALQRPVSMAAGAGAVYLAQFDGVLKITDDGQSQLWAGSLAWDLSSRGYQDGTGAAAKFMNISGLCTDTRGNLFATDSFDDGGWVRKIDSRQRVTTVAGRSPEQASDLKYGLLAGYPVDLQAGSDGPGYLAVLRRPGACTVDGSGNVYVVEAASDIKKVAPDGTVSWYAGANGSLADGDVVEAGFEDIRSVAADRWGNLWVLDGQQERIRRITPDGHVYTVAGGGGKVVLSPGPHEDDPFPMWIPDNRDADGAGPDARFNRPASLALADGKLYATDLGGNLRQIVGGTDWYPADKAMVLQPQQDNSFFFAVGAGRFKPEPARLSVALYGPAAAVGLKVDGTVAAEARHPLYTLQWQATAGSHTLVPMLQRPDTTWVEGTPRQVEVAADGYATQRWALLLPRVQSWVQGTVQLTALSDWAEVELRVDGQPVARGTGLLTAAWDTTTVADGLHRISLATRQPGLDPGGSDFFDSGVQEVFVGNHGFPARKP